MEFLTGVIAIAGTLLGSVVSHSLQSRTANRLHSGTQSAEIRRELRQATARLLASETVFRRLQYDRWGLRDGPAPEKDAATAAALEARSEVIAALAEVQLLTAETEIRARLAELAEATFTLHNAIDEEDLATRSARTRAAASAVVDAIGRAVRSE
uniref:Protein kilB n=1 Tax=Streptomyces sp. NBC_00049 TaxID=2903617 RepID=A0AAU2JW06_9ACTN